MKDRQAHLHPGAPLQLRAGFGPQGRHPAAALLPGRIPEPGRRAAGVVRLEEMLDGYYAVRGWDKEGVPLPATLAELDL